MIEVPEDLAPYLEGMTLAGMTAVSHVVQAALLEANVEIDIVVHNHGDIYAEGFCTESVGDDLALRAHNIGRRAMGLDLDVPDIDTVDRLMRLIYQRGY